MMQDPKNIPTSASSICRRRKETNKAFSTNRLPAKQKNNLAEYASLASSIAGANIKEMTNRGVRPAVVSHAIGTSYLSVLPDLTLPAEIDKQTKEILLSSRNPK
jgi:hypothetical protein